MVPRDGTIADLVAGLQKKANLDDETIRETRVYETHGGKIYREFQADSKIAGINEFVSLYAERVPEEEANMQDGERTINAFNFDREVNRPHGVPFKFVMKPVRRLLALGVGYTLLTSIRARSSSRPRSDCLSGPASRASNLKRSSLLWCLAICIPTRAMWKMVSGPGSVLKNRTIGLADAV